MRGYLEDLKAGGRPMTDKELAEHYKHLYSEVKKQKDEIKKYIKSFEYYIPKEHKTELLRMLGEIE